MSTLRVMDRATVHVLRQQRMSSNRPSATSRSFPYDQRIHSAAPAAAGPNPPSLLLAVKENKGELEKDRQRRGGESESRK